MSEKHDRGDEGESQSDADAKAEESSPFALHSPFAATPIDGGASSAPIDLFEESAAVDPKESHVELPPDIDAATQELQAAPQDLQKPVYPESPRTIVSETVQPWQEPADADFPPLIIYGATPFPRASQPNTPPASTVTEPEEQPEPHAPLEAELTPIEVEPAALEPEPIPLEAERVPAEEEAILVEPVEQPATSEVVEVEVDPASEPVEAWQPAENVESISPAAEPIELTPAQELPTPPQTIDETVDTLPEPVSLELDAPELLEPEPTSDALDLTVPAAVEPELAVTRSGPPEAETLTPAAPIMTTDVEPTTEELASIPVEPTDVIPVAALAATPVTGGTAFTVLPVGVTAGEHAPTATETFAHAHEDVEKRRGVLSLGLLTKLAGIGGFVATVAASVVILFACAGLTPFTSAGLLGIQGPIGWAAIGLGGFAVLLIAGSFLWRSWISPAVLAAVTAVVLTAAWFAIGQYHDHARIGTFNLLTISPFITYVGLGGLALGIVGGFIEHRRMREETHVLAAVFTNILAIAGGTLLWIIEAGKRVM